MALEFDEESHIYRLDGRIVPGVTQVISPLIDLSRVPEDVLERARKFGVAVHMACELHDKGILDMGSLDPQLVPYLETWDRFKSECQWENECIEMQVVHGRYLYAGRIDRVGTINKRGRRVRGILDIKTGTMIDDTVGIQLAAYQGAFNSTRHVSEMAPTRWSVRLTGDGKYKLDEWAEKDDWNMFLALLQIHFWKEKYGH